MLIPKEKEVVKKVKLFNNLKFIFRLHPYAPVENAGFPFI